jgi:kynurenine aminotransferase
LNTRITMASQPPNGQSSDRSNLITFSSRLKEGRALALDVWTIFRWVVTICKCCMYWISPWVVDSAVNLPVDCINLGQGYMNFAPPKWVTEAAELALRDVAPNHYSHPRGRVRLREAIKSFYAPQFQRELDVESEILVTSGANEGLHSTKTSNHNPSDPICRAVFRLYCFP